MSGYGDYAASGPMAVVLLRYLVPVERVNAARPAHIDWLCEQTAAGRVVLAGRRGDDGGVLIVRGTAEDARALADGDPYLVQGVATAEVVPFNATLALPALAALLA